LTAPPELEAGGAELAGGAEPADDLETSPPEERETEEEGDEELDITLPESPDELTEELPPE
jgi:hypothetical protein